VGRSLLAHPRRRDLNRDSRRDLSRLRLRPARPGDGPATHAVFFAAVREGAAAHYSDAERKAWAPSPEAPSSWEPRLLAGTTVVAEERGRIVGFMTLGSDGFLDLAYVDPGWIGRGVGGLLHRAILEIARRAGLALLATEASLVARGFFHRQGWRETARQSVIRHGVALTNFRMELAL